MAGIIRVRQGETFEDAELSFNQIEPGGFCGRPDGLDPELPQQCEKVRMIVDVVQVVQNYEKPPSRIATAQVTESFADVQDGLATTKHATEAVCMNIIESQELLRSFQAPIKSLACAKGVSVEPKPNPRRASDPEDPTRRNTLPRYAAGSVDRASECVFFTVERRIVRGLPGSHPLGRQSFTAQQPTDPLIGYRRQQFSAATVLG